MLSKTRKIRTTIVPLRARTSNIKATQDVFMTVSVTAFLHPHIITVGGMRSFNYKDAAMRHKAPAISRELLLSALR